MVEYFKNVDEPTVIFMTGDHQPRINDASMNALTKGQYKNWNDEEMMRHRYAIPFMIWANYDIDEAEGIDISANYLSSLLMDTAGLKKTAYQDYLTSLREQLPVLTANYCYDEEGNFYSADDFDQVKDLLNDYEILQYNHLFDPKNRAEGFAD